MMDQFSHCRFNLLGYHTNAMKHTDIGSTCINRTVENEDGWLTGCTDADVLNLTLRRNPSDPCHTILQLKQ